MTFETKVRVSEDSMWEKKITPYCTRIPTQEASFALSMIERFGLVSGKDGGEDSGGRHHIALMEPEAVVERAFKIAALSFRHMESAGLFVQLPDLNQVNAERDAEKAEESAKRQAKKASEKMATA